MRRCRFDNVDLWYFLHRELKPVHSDVGYIIPVVTIPVKLEYQWREGRFENMINKLPVRVPPSVYD